jgi:hypothetical protein
VCVRVSMLGSVVLAGKDTVGMGVKI